MSLYTDRASHFKVNTKTAIPHPSKDVITQLQRALEELSINIIYARSPQAKGRVERVIDTFQDRCVNMMRTRKIDNIEDANRFLADKFMPWFNTKCTKAPLSDVDVHRPAEGIDLESILCEKVLKSVRKDFTFQHKNVKYQIEPGHMTSRLFRQKITLEIRTNGTIKANFDGKYLSFYQIKND
jgi:hypothetical protein